MLIAGVSTPWLPPTPHQSLQLPVSMLCSYYDDIVVVSTRTPFRRPRASSAHSALLSLITVLDETTLAAHLRVSVPTLRRYLDRTLPMNWIIHTRLTTMPELLAASANSPYWDGAASGWRSIRSQILLEMPTGGTPPVLRSWDDWQAASRSDSTRRHWDVWPRPEYGTLEVRIMDQPTSLRRTAELAADVQRLVREAADFGGEPFDRAEYDATRDRAGREGGGPEAERQLELGPEAAVREIAALTLG